MKGQLAGAVFINGGAVDSDPYRSAFALMDERTNIAGYGDVGHRSALISPAASRMAFGQVSGWSTWPVDDALVLSNTNWPSDVEFTAFPYRDYPYLMLKKPSGATQAPWSFTIQQNVGSLASAAVSIVDAVSGQSLSVNVLRQSSSQIVWEVDGFDYDTEYEVAVSGLINGEQETYTYPVTIVYAEIFDVAAPLESGESSSSSSASGRLPGGQGDRDGFAFQLEGDVGISKSSIQFSGGGGFFVRVYGPDEQLIAEFDDASETISGLIAGEYTIVAASCRSDFADSCYSDTVDYSISIN
jgi:hypothetical protein